MFPGSRLHEPEVPSGVLNTWRGFQVKERAGKYPLLTAHLRNVICAGNDDHLAFVLDWLANAVQRPQGRCPSALVLRSAVEGTGKTLLIASLFKRIFGDAARTVSKKGELTGAFNKHLENTVMLGVEEAVYAGDHEGRNVLKDLISNETINVQPKGVDIYTAPNYLHMIFTTNEDWAIPAGLDARRFAVFDVVNPMANMPEYFVPLVAEIENGGAEAFLHDMMNRTITHDLGRPPETAALLEQTEHSMTPIQQWACEVARTGTVHWISPGPLGGVSTRSASVEAGLLVHREGLRDFILKGLSVHERNGFPSKFGKFVRSIGVGSSQGADGKYRYTFPSLADFVALVRKNVNKTLVTLAEEEANDDAFPNAASTTPPFAEVPC